MFFEPTTIEPDSSAVAEKEDGLQYIHSRIIRNESGLCKLLAERYGKNFEIEVSLIQSKSWRVSKLTAGCEAASQRVSHQNTERE